MFRRFDDIFETCGWRVITLKYGKLQKAAFAKSGGERLREWIDACSNADYAALTYQGGAAWRERLLADFREDSGAAALVGGYDDNALAALMTNLGGHDLESLVEAFEAAQDSRPTLFIAYTIKGYGLPFAGPQRQSRRADDAHPDNRSAAPPSASPRARNGRPTPASATTPPPG